jgi:hypothetical protein
MELPRRAEQCHRPLTAQWRHVSRCTPQITIGENIDEHKFESGQLARMKKACQQHCFSTLNHNLAYCYNDAHVIKFVWTNLVKNQMQGGARSFED